MKKLIFIVFLVFSAGIVLASHINTPPPLPGQPVALQLYLQDIYDTVHIFDITDVAPNGSRKGNKGQHIIYDNSGTFELWINTDNSTTWQQI